MRLRFQYPVFSIQYSVFSCVMVRRVLLALCASGIFLVCASPGKAETGFERDCAKLAARKGKDAERLHALFKLDWEHTMRENPEFATEVGYPGQNDRWTDSSLDAIERRKRELGG